MLSMNKFAGTVCLAVLLSLSAGAQNLVVNGDFESPPLSVCGYNPDLHLSGSTWWGIAESAVSGARFVGFHPSFTPANVEAETIGLSFNQPLTVGTTYEISFYIAIGLLDLSFWTYWTDRNMGNNPGYVKAYMGGSSCAKSELVFTSSIVSDGSQGWVHQHGVFTANYAHSNLVLVPHGPNPDLLTPYMLLDNVCLAPLGAQVCSTPLPIELTSFKAECKGEVVLLDWSTATEINNDYFTILRSSNGMDFEEIGVIPGAGDSHAQLNYSHYDSQPKAGLSYYRLKQTDHDGSSSLSRQVALHCTGGGGVVLFPNPAKNGLNIHSEYQIGQTVRIDVYDQVGRAALSETIEEVGSSSIRIDIGQLVPGQYTLKHIGPTGKEQYERFIKQ